ncbi:MAG: glycosyltransferase N-terminal domain-containing protein [Bacteroidota bacterium]
MYNLLLGIARLVLPLVALFHKKIRLFVNGRKYVFKVLDNAILNTDKVLWIHTASLGEFEQGLPVLYALRKEKPEHKILVTFFSPSGYEVKKNSSVADVMTYLPLDTKSNVRKFLDAVHPEFVVFVKYEFWPNYLTELKRRSIPTFLVSGIFRETQAFFKPYGGFMRKRLAGFTHFFVQEAHSKALLNSMGLTNVTVSGDTRFDRVSELPEQENSLRYIEEFLQDSPCVVVGSSWPEDAAIYLPFINGYKGHVKFIIAPHLIDPSSVAQLERSIIRKTVLFSERAGKTLSQYDVFLIDTIGLLTKIYSYATLAYVGGGMGTKGLHNVLEPAVFGIPVVIGKQFKKFNEARELVALGGVVSVKNSEELALAFQHFLTDKGNREKAGYINTGYIRKKSGATATTVAYLLR